MNRKVNLAEDLRTGDFLYLDDDNIIRYSDREFTIKELWKIEPRVLKVERNEIEYIYRSGSSKKVDKKFASGTTKYKNGLKFNPRFKEMCRTKEKQKNKL